MGVLLRREPAQTQCAATPVSYEAARVALVLYMTDKGVLQQQTRNPHGMTNLRGTSRWFRSRLILSSS